ncbi:hypothetical protein C0416_00200 [bacterium]|nr:hypothetical protein [bacterium]
MSFPLKIKAILCIFGLATLGWGNCVYASSYSSSFSLNDEALDFAHNTGSLESASYSMDLSGIFWTDRPSESASFKIIDANSDLVAVTPPIPPTPGGSGGSVAGGRPDSDSGETDSALIGALPQEESLPDLNLHGVPEDEAPEPLKPVKPVIPNYTEVTKIETAYDDFDGCSAQFEVKYMDTNPYINDTDSDSVEDCDEDWVYGTNPIMKNDNFIHTGIAKSDEFVYTQMKPLFVGRSDFGINEIYLEDFVQLELKLIDPFTEIGMFFLELKDDLNFIGESEIELINGTYYSTLYVKGEKQEKADEVFVDLDKDYELLKVDTPDRGTLKSNGRYVYLEGETGSNYGVVAMWVNEDYVDVSAVLAEENGDYIIASPVELEDGLYSIYIYSVYKDNDKFIQTNHHVISIKMENGVPYILGKVLENKVPEWNVESNYTQHASAEKTDSMNLLPYIVFFTIIFISYLLLIWKKEN